MQTLVRREDISPAEREELRRPAPPQVFPLHERYARELGLGPESYTGLTALIGDIGAYHRELTSKIPLGDPSGITVVEAAPVGPPDHSPGSLLRVPRNKRITDDEDP